MSEFVVLKPVNTYEDAETLRVIRNECRNFMTRYNNIISPEQQREWWTNLDERTNKLYLLHKVVDGVISYIIGYGYIRVENGSVLLTGGLNESERGKGHGVQLFRYLVENAKEYNLPIRLELLKTNTKAFLVYNSIGFRVTKDDGQNIYMEYHYDSVI